MSTGHVYPPELARHLEAHWPEEHPPSLPFPRIAEALGVAFHASLMSEEARPTRFRLLLTPPDRLPESGEPNRGALRLRFDTGRPLVPDELRRLAPSVPFETSLIGAHLEDDALRIWGVAHSGPAWLAPSWGGRNLVPNWTHDPIVHVTAPGHLAVRCAGQLVGGIERGAIVDAMMDVFESSWLPALFTREREEIQRQHAASQASQPSPTDVEHSLIGRISQHMLRRVIRLVRNARHGGMVLVADLGGGRDEGLGGLRLKYRLQEGEPARRYRTLLMRVLEMVAAATSKTSVGWDDFVENASPELAALEQSVFEWSRVIANLAAIDGAVVLDKRFTLVGFGAEVSASLPSPSRVWRASDVEGTRLRVDGIESVGTRHRAAYRFVNDHPNGLAIVISHDGGVSFVANRSGEIVVWEQSMSP
ncbi:MAG: hypothetical protein JST00_45435 [Deltaproteobacteria bacterium]|nr:hypothetical protein [Deltaproteobacteria bacterium]